MKMTTSGTARLANPLHHHLRTRFLTGALLVLCASPLFAVKTRVLTDDSFSDFNKGVSTGTELLAAGRLQVGPVSKQLASTPEGITWDVALDAKSGAVYMATGHAGKVFRRDAGGKLELWADLREVEATVLALDKSGALYVGASPGGKIYRITEKGKPNLYYETGEKYVWDLAFGPDDALYAATGTHGKIYRITDDRKGALYYDSDATNVMALDFDGQGQLIAATQGKAYLVQVSAANKGYILYAASQDELRTLTVDKSGNIYAAANSARISSVFDKSSSTTSTSSSAGDVSKLGGSGIVVQVHPNGFVNGLWAAPEGPIHRIIADASTSSILVAAGKNGKLYRVNTDDASYSVVADIDEPLIASLARTPDAILLGSANKACLYELKTSAPKSSGQFASRALDADSTVRWGNLAFTGEIASGSKISWETRSGNTSEPSDGTWSPWKSAEAVGNQIVKIASPVAQYLQYRVTLSDETAPAEGKAFIDSVKVYYIEKNVPPVIKKLTLEKVPGSPAAAQAAALAAAAARMQSSSDSSDDEKAKQASDEAAKAATAAARAAQAAVTAKAAAAANVDLQNSQKLTISWSVTDANDDKLRYNLYYKGEDETVWKQIEENLTTTRHQFSTEAIPDGKYRFKLEATDRYENQETSASTVSMISQIYTVDNSAPEIRDIKARKLAENDYEITARASDATSIISAAEYNLNAADEWLPLAPTDGIFDFQSEDFRFTVKPEKKQPEHTLSIRVYDHEGNSRVEKVLLK